jgi:hypothetical protein
MPTHLPRVNVVLDEPLYGAVRRLAVREGVSLSTQIRCLVEEALELHEDVAMTRWAVEREKTFARKTALSHDKVWRHVE